MTTPAPHSPAPTSSFTAAPSKDRLSSYAVQALLQESAALSHLAHALPVDFRDALGCLAGLKGKVICTGVGKSGHIARKVSSTFASTGTPSSFLHPTEAVHGDLGILTADDALLLCSNSGETAELAPLIHYAHHLNIPLLSLTSNATSMLARASHYKLLLPRVEEICSLGLAPTTSTLLMLALGDVLAVCLMQLKNFQRNDYHARHPGGALGLKLLTVGQIMRRGSEIPVAFEGTPMDQALVVMTEKACGCLGILAPSSQKLRGIITDGDLRRHMNPALLTQTVEAIMTPDPLTISEEMLVGDALALMNSRGVTMLFVHDTNQNMTGLVHLHDCLRPKID